MGLIHCTTFSLPRTDLETLMHHVDKRLSALAMIYLSYAFPEEALFLLRNGLTSANPRQREYACDMVGDCQFTQLYSIMTTLLQDEDLDVRQAARINLGLYD